MKTIISSTFIFPLIYIKLEREKKALRKTDKFIYGLIAHINISYGKHDLF